jgi:hypothetical protein
MEYALYRNPTNPESRREFTAAITTAGSSNLFNLYYTRRLDMPDARIWVEFTTNLVIGAWMTGTTHIAEQVIDLPPTQRVQATVINPAVNSAPFGAGRLNTERIAP